MTRTRAGTLYGAAAYVLWGLFPLYWPLLRPAGAVEILAHRIVWSLLAVAVVVVLVRRTAELRRLASDLRSVVLLAVAAIFIAVNWGTYIYGVNTHHVVETSLGYFANPLVTVLLGVFVLRERLRPVQWGAIALAGVAVVVLTIGYGHPPWIAATLACSFATYGLIKKTVNAGALETLTTETAVLTPLAAVYLGWLAATGRGTFTTHGAGHALLLAAAGVVTAVPLLFFGAAATRVSLTTLGLLQYVTPTMQFLIGVIGYGERLPPVRLVGFVLVWAALAVFTADSVRAAHRSRRAVRALEPAAEPAH